MWTAFKTNWSGLFDRPLLIQTHCTQVLSHCPTSNSSPGGYKLRLLGISQCAEAEFLHLCLLYLCQQISFKGQTRLLYVILSSFSGFSDSTPSSVCEKCIIILVVLRVVLLAKQCLQKDQGV